MLHTKGHQLDLFPVCLVDADRNNVPNALAMSTKDRLLLTPDLEFSFLLKVKSCWKVSLNDR